MSDPAAHIAVAFSAAAPTYDQLAHIQTRVADRLVDGMAMLGSPRRVLDVGCGTGFLTRRLSGLFPEADITALDIAPGMIREAARLAGGAPNIRFATADAATYTDVRPFDLLVSSSTLHWIQPLDRTCRHLAGLLEPFGSFAFAIMLEHTLRELHGARVAIAPGNPPALRMPAPARVRDALAAAGLAIQMEEIQEQVAHAGSAGEMLNKLKGLGVTGGPLSRGTRPLTRGELGRLIAHYEASHRDEHGVRATYQIGYFWGTRNG